MNSKENEALIEAAPDMLAALKGVVKWADDDGKRFKFSAASDSDTVQRIYAAIARATGGKR